MSLLQIASLQNLGKNPGFWDNFLWPLLVLIVVGTGTLIWKFLIQKKFKIKVFYTESYRGFFEDKYYLILRINLINETATPINNLTININKMSRVTNGIPTMTEGMRLPEGGFIAPVAINLVNDIIESPIDTIAEHSNIIGNLCVEMTSELVREIKIDFKYLTKRKSKKIYLEQIVKKRIE